MPYIDVDAAVTLFVNSVPLTDDGDFKTRETSVAYNATGMDLVWNFVTTAGAVSQTAVTPTTEGDYDWAHVGGGMYSIEIPASGGASINNSDEGYGWFSGVCDGVLPWVSPVYGFRAAVINNTMIDGATGPAVAGAEMNLVDGAITAAKIAADAITDAKVASDVTIASVTGAVGSVTGNVGGNVVGSVASVVGAVGSVAGNVGGIAGTINTLDQLDAAQDSQHGTTQGLVNTVAGYLDTEILAIKAKTDNLPSDPADQSAVETAITAATSGLASQSSVNTIDGIVNQILVDTAEIGAAGAGLTAIIGADGDTLKTLSDQLDAIPTTIRVKKNAALAGFPIIMLDTSGDPATGKTVAGTVSIDGAAFTSLTNAISEVSGGLYAVDLAQADTNGNTLVMRFTATGCRTRFVEIVTQP